jgi:excisionase family DNA binding protein
MDEVFTKDEAAEFLKMTPKTIEYLVVSNQIPYSRIGKRSVSFSRSRLLEWLSEREGIPHKHKPHKRRITTT